MPETHIPDWSILFTFKKWIRRAALIRERKPCATRELVEQDDIEEGTANAQSAVVIDKAKLSELIQKETDS